MAENFYTILTNIGKAKIANATALKTQLNITKIAVGDGNGSYYEPTESQTVLKNQVWTGNISSIKVDDNNSNWIIVEAVIPATDGGFTIREAAIFDDSNSMIAIGKFPETYKPVASDGSTKDLYIKFVIEVSNASSVTLTLDPTVIIATKNDIKDLAGVGRTTETVKKNADDIKSLNTQIAENNIYPAGGTANEITVATADENYTYTQFKRLSIKATADNTGNVTINVDGKGTIPALKYDGSQLVTGTIKSGKVYDFYYDTTGKCFFLIAKASGDAVAADVLAGKKCSTDNGDVVGSMPNNGAITIIPSGNDQAIPQGYHNGNGVVKAATLVSQAGGTAIITDDANCAVYTAGISKAKEIQIGITGTVRVSFNLYNSQYQAYTAYAQLYLNGSPIGDLKSVDVNSISVSQDISVRKGDLIQVYAKTTNSSYASTISYFRISIDGSIFGKVNV